MGIQRDIAIGKVAEQKVESIITGIGGVVTFVEKQNRLLWDIACELYISNVKKIFTIEIKNDLYSLKSGNIAIEMMNTKSMKPSGLSATKADLWVVVLGDEIWIAKTSLLKEFVDKNKPHRVIDSGGDNNAYLYLYKRDIILNSVFTRIDNINKKQLKDRLNELIL